MAEGVGGDPRPPPIPKKLKHKLTVVLLYGLLSFVFQMASRGEANRELSRPAFLATLQSLFPELKTLPHADTLNGLLADIDVVHLEEAHVALVRGLIRNKKFRRYLIAQCYPIAIDGTRA
ncbi:MAG: transposase family protein [Pseudomonadota bacterium]|nr:transposase family protein [Pseudomonadota bacterium]